MQLDKPHVATEEIKEMRPEPFSLLDALLPFIFTSWNISESVLLEFFVLNNFFGILSLFFNIRISLNKF